MNEPAYTDLVVVFRWSYKTYEYTPITRPRGWRIVLFTEKMDTPINCTNCGRKLVFGDSFTSKEIHTAIGLGYPVCERCYQVELRRAARYYHER